MSEENNTATAPSEKSKSLFDKIGGRKFTMALITIGIAASVDIFASNGLSVNMLGLLTAVYATFSASNTLVTRKELEARPAPEQPAVVQSNDDVKALARELIPVLTNISTNIEALKKSQSDMNDGMATSQQALSALLKKISGQA